MACPECRTVNAADALICTLCGTVLRDAPAPNARFANTRFTDPNFVKPGFPPLRSTQGVKTRPAFLPRRGNAPGDASESEAVQPWPVRPLPALGIGLLLVPLMKLLWIPNYVFNFLLTLVHEIGHSVFAWLMGMPSIPKLGLFGGGVTQAIAQIPLLCFAIFAALGWLAWQARGDRHWFILLVIAALVYPIVAYTSAENLFVAGGVLFEIGGATACFYWVLTGPTSMGVERPIYALWGWWMLLSRTSECWLMLRDSSYWEANIIAKSGLPEGLVNDLPRFCENLNLAPNTVLSIVLVLGLISLPSAFGLSWWKRRLQAQPA